MHVYIRKESLFFVAVMFMGRVVIQPCSFPIPSIHLKATFSHCSDIIDDAEYATYCQWYDYITTVQKPHLDLIGEHLYTYVHTVYTLTFADQ